MSESSDAATVDGASVTEDGDGGTSWVFLLLTALLALLIGGASNNS